MDFKQAFSQHATMQINSKGSQLWYLSYPKEGVHESVREVLDFLTIY